MNPKKKKLKKEDQKNGTISVSPFDFFHFNFAILIPQLSNQPIDPYVFINSVFQSDFL
jgi:hypothetical protein